MPWTADLILYVADSSVPLDENDREILRMISRKKAIILLNKSDLEPVLESKELEKYANAPILSISAKEREGLEELEARIREMFFQGDISFNDEIYITNARRKKHWRMPEKAWNMWKTALKTRCRRISIPSTSWEPMKRWERFWGKIWERIWSTKSFQNSVPASEEKICQ